MVASQVFININVKYGYNIYDGDEFKENYMILILMKIILN